MKSTPLVSNIIRNGPDLLYGISKTNELPLTLNKKKYFYLSNICTSVTNVLLRLRFESEFNNRSFRSRIFNSHAVV